MAKLKLEFDYEIDFFLLGISCHLPDYRTAFVINKALHLDLERQEDMDLRRGRNNEKHYFSFFQHDDPENYLTVNLINNRSEKGFFVPEHKQMDYFLQLWLPNNEEDILIEMQKKIQAQSNILACVSFDADALKSKNNFFF